MSESEKLERTISAFESEVAQLTADITDLEQRLATATTTAETAIAAAERRADDAAQAAAVDAEQGRLALATALNRKRLALVAATADLQTARHGLAESKRAAEFVRLQSVLDEIAVAATAIDGAPMDCDLWAALSERVNIGQGLFFQAGGRGEWISSPQWARSQLFRAYAAQIDWTLGSGTEAPKPIPVMPQLLGLDRAGGLIKEMTDSKAVYPRGN